MNPKFTIEHQYQDYLKRIHLSEDMLYGEQKLQLRMSFYAGSASLLFLMREDIGQLSLEEGAAVLDAILKELKEHAEALKKEITAKTEELDKRK